MRFRKDGRDVTLDQVSQEGSGMNEINLAWSIQKGQKMAPILKSKKCANF